MTVRHCVMIPFLNRHEQVARCLDLLITQANEHTVFLLVDDGSTPEALRSPVLQPELSRQNVHLIHHRDNFGVAAARNSAIDWCRRREIEILIMIDSDCLPDSNVIEEHLRLHHEHPEVTCIGGRIAGEGKSVWAQLDGLTSWIHASPHGSQDPAKPEFRRVEHPYHLATTNLSIKLSQLPDRPFVFDERLVTGEDCLLVRELRRLGRKVYFSATPKVIHHDREHLGEVVRHHYTWGHHQYFIQLGGDISPRCFHPLYRLVFALLFLPLLPIFALAGTWFNCRALWSGDRNQWMWAPLIYLLWLAKGCAVLEAAVRPQACLREARESLQYEEARLDE